MIKSGLGFIIYIYYRAGIYYSETCKNCFKIVGKIKIKKKKKDWDDMAVDVDQRERSDIKRYASAFSNILVADPRVARGYFFNDRIIYV